MDKTYAPVTRRWSWALLLASFALALSLALLMVQGLSAQPAADETRPVTTPAADESQPANPQTTTMLTTTVAPSQTVLLTVTGNLTDSTVITPSAVLEPDPVSTTTIIFPLVSKPLPRIAISATRPNSANQWQVYWEDKGDDYQYRLQQSQAPDFSELLSDELLSDTSRDIAHSASPFNAYYYRVRLETSNKIGPWSWTRAVTGAYADNFNDPSTGWTMRRTTYLEETVSWYGVGNEAGNLIIVVADRWDWFIVSPLQAAPEPPYVIEYRSRVHDASNLVSGGAVLGGDWNYEACPDPLHIYGTDHCFNHFYNFNYIHYGAMKLLFEEVDRLFWCLGCGGSPLKRLGDLKNWRDIDPVFSNSTARDWHTYRIEVRESGLRLKIDGVDKGAFGTDAYVNDPYFGVFASTDEYKPSIWFYDYYKVTPLDE